jgi:hypothetical protein
MILGQVNPCLLSGTVCCINDFQEAFVTNLVQSDTNALEEESIRILKFKLYDIGLL